MYLPLNSVTPKTLVFGCGDLICLARIPLVERTLKSVHDNLRLKGSDEYHYFRLVSSFSHNLDVWFSLQDSPLQLPDRLDAVSKQDCDTHRSILLAVLAPFHHRLLI